MLAYIDLGNWNVWYETEGSGPPLVLLHHWHGTGAASWAPAARYLARRFRLIIPDLRGHGATPNPGLGPISPRSTACDLLVLMDGLGLEQAHWAGSSFGGHALLWLAAARPERMLSLATVGAPHALASQTREAMRQSGLNPRPQWIQETKERHTALGPEGWRWFAAESVRQAEMHEGSDLDLQALASLRCPALVVNGDNDRFTPVEQAVELFRAIPGARLLVLPGGGHWVHKIYPERFAACMIENALGQG